MRRGENRRRIWEKSKLKISSFLRERTRPPNPQPATATTRATTRHRESARRAGHQVVSVEMAIHGLFGRLGSIPTSRVGFYTRGL